MLNMKVVQSQDILTLCALAKTIKAQYAAYFIIDDDTITVYGAQDFMFSTITRTIVENTTKLKGTLGVYMKEEGSFAGFCRTMVPFIDMEYSNNTLFYPLDGSSIETPLSIEETFLYKKESLNQLIEVETQSSFNLDQQMTQFIKETAAEMRASTSQKLIEIAPRYLITIYSGFIPVNKADVLNISVLSGDVWFLCKYEILKKKAPPIHVFVKYNRM